MLDSIVATVEALVSGDTDTLLRVVVLAVPLVLTLSYWSKRPGSFVRASNPSSSGYDAWLALDYHPATEDEGFEPYDPANYSAEVLDSPLVFEAGVTVENRPSASHDLAYPHIKYKAALAPPAAMLAKATAFYERMNARRSCRFFSSAPVPREVIDMIVLAAGTAPSGAHMQPWTFVVVQDPEVKKAIRDAAETEEKINYERRMGDDWKADLAPLGTDWRKPFLEIAPYLIVVFKQAHGTRPDGSKQTHYYADKSVGIATGMLIAAIHQAGLTTLTHTPTPMGFLSSILNRPANEKPYLLLPVGYPATEATVPDLSRKDLADIMTVI